MSQNEARWLFLGQFWPLLNQALFLEGAVAVLKIGSSLKPNHHREINLPKSMKRSVGTCEILYFIYNLTLELLKTLDNQIRKSRNVGNGSIDIGGLYQIREHRKL